MNGDLVAEEFKHQKALHKVGRGRRLSRRQMETWPWGRGMEAGKPKLSWGSN